MQGPIEKNYYADASLTACDFLQIFEQGFKKWMEFSLRNFYTLQKS